MAALLLPPQPPLQPHEWQFTYVHPLVYRVQHRGYERYVAHEMMRRGTRVASGYAVALERPEQAAVVAVNALLVPRQRLFATTAATLQERLFVSSAAGAGPLLMDLRGRATWQGRDGAFLRNYPWGMWDRTNCELRVVPSSYVFAPPLQGRRAYKLAWHLTEDVLRTREIKCALPSTDDLRPWYPAAVGGGLESPWRCRRCGCSNPNSRCDCHACGTEAVMVRVDRYPG